jgi:hypothetical protein
MSKVSYTEKCLFGRLQRTSLDFNSFNKMKIVLLL